LLCVGEHAAELEKVITLFAFFNPVNIGEGLFINDADDGSLVEPVGLPSFNINTYRKAIGFICSFAI